MASKKKPKAPKVRGVWKINPKTRVKPNKKRNLLLDEICFNCMGLGTDAEWKENVLVYKECDDCGGTGSI